MKLSFMHCSDLHLGFAQFGSDERFEDFGQAFSAIAQDALERKVDYLLIAGDFFNKRSINSKTLSQAVQIFQSLQAGGVKVIAIEGNHDKAPYGEGDSWMRFLHEQGLIRLLQPEFAAGKLILDERCLVEFPGVRFLGLGYLGSMTARRLRELAELLEPSLKFTVLLLHGAVDKLLHLGGVSRETLAGLEDVVDYVALGHVHERYEVDNWIYNPGAPESWDLGEGGKEKGYYHVVVEGKNHEVEHIPSKPRPIFCLDLDLTYLGGPSEIGSLCIKRFDELWRGARTPSMLRLVLSGEVEFNPLAISQSDLIQELKRAFPLLHVEITNRVRLKGEGHVQEGGQLNREQIEERVLQRLVQTNLAAAYPGDQTLVNEGVKLVQELKNLSLLGDEETMINMVRAWAQTIQGKEGSREDL